MRPSLRLAVAGIAVAALTVGVAAPAGAQESLGFEINITEGGPGEIVAGQVNTDDVAEHCVTDLEAFQARFLDLFEGPFVSGGFVGELTQRFFPDPENIVFENHAQTAYVLLLAVALGLSGLLGPEPAEDALPQTFVMTFADIATQEPVGEMGNFDPDTGEGTVVVPDIEPGFWAVAAACVGPSFDLDVLEAGIRAGGVFLEELGAPPVDPLSPEFAEFMQDFLDSEATGFELLIEFLGEVGPTFLAPIMVPDAFGAVIFCILDAEGECPDGEVPPLPDDIDGPGPARPVVVQPVFTG